MREEAYSYPTDFSSMSEEWIRRLSRRGEQLTKALVAEHAAELVEHPVRVVAPETADAPLRQNRYDG
jgi:hypothetical protein